MEHEPEFEPSLSPRKRAVLYTAIISSIIVAATYDPEIRDTKNLYIDQIRTFFS